MAICGAIPLVHAGAAPGAPLAPIRGMHIAHPERGTTLVEALVAASLLITIVSGIAHLIIQTHRFAVRAEQMTVAVVAAASRLERLRAIPWEYDLAGMERDAPTLALSPPDALDREVTGFHETLDVSGEAAVDSAAGTPAFVQRWAIVSASSAGERARAIEVCVFAWPAADAAPPLACLASVRTRQP